MTLEQHKIISQKAKYNYFIKKSQEPNEVWKKSASKVSPQQSKTILV